MLRKHAHDFSETCEDDRRRLARILKRTLFRVQQRLPPYNLVLHNSSKPITEQGRPEHWSTLQLDYHWHIAIIPLLTTVASFFEWGTGFYINHVPPEDAARYLKK